MSNRTPIRLVQLQHPKSGRRVAVVAGSELRLQLKGIDSIYRLAEMTLKAGPPLARFISESPTGETLSYDAVYSGKSAWPPLPAFAHPAGPAPRLVTGTGFTLNNNAT